jgi:hypothetical protein
MPHGLNRLGQVVGWSDGHGFLWRPTVPPEMRDLGPGRAYAINNNSQVVGASNGRAVIWEDLVTVPRDLNTLLPPGSGWVLEAATGINDQGQIVGFGTHDGQSRTFLLNPSSDTIAPTSTAELSVPANSKGWHHDDVTVAISAVDNTGGSGVDQITYSASGAQVIAEVNVKASSNSTSVVIDAEGVTTVSFHATDNALNVEPSH